MPPVERHEALLRTGRRDQRSRFDRGRPLRPEGMHAPAFLHALGVPHAMPETLVDVRTVEACSHRIAFDAVAIRRYRRDTGRDAVDLAAGECILVDEYDAQPKLGRLVRGRHAGRPGTDDGDVGGGPWRGGSMIARDGGVQREPRSNVEPGARRRQAGLGSAAVDPQRALLAVAHRTEQRARRRSAICGILIEATHTGDPERGGHAFAFASFDLTVVESKADARAARDCAADPQAGFVHAPLAMMVATHSTADLRR